MPSSMPHLIIAKNFNPNASIDFYVGNLAPDAIKDADIKSQVHFENIPDIETALKKFALKATNDYLMGILLHLYVDWKWKTSHMVDFANKTGEKWFLPYREEIGKITAYAYHNSDWSHELYDQLEHWDYN